MKDGITNNLLRLVINPKTLVISMASIVVAMLTDFLIASTYELGTERYVFIAVGVFAASFLVFYAIQSVVNFIYRCHCEKRNLRQKYNNYENGIRESLKHVSIRQKDTMRRLIEQKNKPIRCYAMLPTCELERFFAHNESQIKEDVADGTDFYTLEPIKFKKGDIIMECRLKDDIYAALKNAKNNW